MGEKIYKHNNAESERSSGELDSNSQEVLDQLAEKGRQSEQEHAQKIKETLEDIREEAKEESAPAAELIKQEQEAIKNNEPANLFVNDDLKSLKYKRTLQSVRKDLKPTERVLSRVIHNPAVDAVSEVAGKTIARPSGFLVGSIFAFLGSSAFLWTSKHYGYEYNFLLFAMFFVAGFVLGILVELAIRLANRKSPKK